MSARPKKSKTPGHRSDPPELTPSADDPPTEHPAAPSKKIIGAEKPKSEQPTTAVEPSAIKMEKRAAPDFHPATGQRLSEVEGESPDLKKTPRQKTKIKKGKPTVTIAPGLRSTRDIFFNRPK